MANGWIDVILTTNKFIFLKESKIQNDAKNNNNK